MLRLTGDSSGKRQEFYDTWEALIGQTDCKQLQEGRCALTLPRTLLANANPIVTTQRSPDSSTFNFHRSPVITVFTHRDCDNIV